jgi:hypothetical protein
VVAPSQQDPSPNWAEIPALALCERPRRPCTLAVVWAGSHSREAYDDPRHLLLSLPHASAAVSQRAALPITCVRPPSNAHSRAFCPLVLIVSLASFATPWTVISGHPRLPKVSQVAHRQGGGQNREARAEPAVRASARSIQHHGRLAALYALHCLCAFRTTSHVDTCQRLLTLLGPRRLLLHQLLVSALCKLAWLRRL